MGALSGVEHLKEMRESVKVLRYESEELRILAEELRTKSVTLLEQSKRVRLRLFWYTANPGCFCSDDDRRIKLGTQVLGNEIEPWAAFDDLSTKRGTRAL